MGWKVEEELGTKSLLKSNLDTFGGTLQKSELFVSLVIHAAYICLSHPRREANMNEVNIHTAGLTFDRV